MTAAETLSKAKAAQSKKARELLKSAAGAAKQLESDVRELVSMRAWEVLGYENFSVMWERENGFECPNLVQVLVVVCLREEGSNTRNGRAVTKLGPNGHRQADIARLAGLPVRKTSNGEKGSSATSAIMRQLDHGVPPERVVKGESRGNIARVISEFGDRPYEPAPRKRPQPRRLGKRPDELVDEGFKLLRREADEIAEIARAADVPKSEIYRQAVAEYRHRESRLATSQT